jgi:ribonuclease Z
MDEGRALSPEDGDGGPEDGGVSDDETPREGSAAAAAARASNPLLAAQRTRSGWLLAEDEEPLVSNKSGMQAFFLSPAAAPGGLRAATSAVVRTLQSAWLFECGEDTQRTLLGHRLLDWKRLDRIFLGSMSPEAVLGLPGMLCTLSASREKGLEASDIPVHVYGPPGLVQFVSSMLAVSRTYLEMPVILHEFTPRAVPPEALAAPQEVLRRSRLYAMPLPPDQLNPEGYYDGTLAPMLARNGRRRAGGGADLRSGALPQALPPRGDPARSGLAVSDMTWTVLVDAEWTVQAVPLRAGAPALGFVLQEADRSGRLYPELATALGVEDRDQFTELKDGRAVRTPGGAEVRPGQCVGPPRRGRRLAIVPPCEDSAVLAARAGAVDVLIHSMVPPPGGGGDRDPLEAARVAGRCAAAVRAQELVLWQSTTGFLDSPLAADKGFPLAVLEEGRRAFGDDHVTLGGSLDVWSWDRPAGAGAPPEMPPELAPVLRAALEARGLKEDPPPPS